MLSGILLLIAVWCGAVLSELLFQSRSPREAQYPSLTLQHFFHVSERRVGEMEGWRFGETESREKKMHDGTESSGRSIKGGGGG